MATRYLTALDYSDWRTNAVLKKLAKKRPLGDLESRYQYTPPQPVLSCRTVDIDVSGTRTYRPRSTTDILAEQQTLIHRLFRKGRTAASAPARRSPRKGLGLVNEGDSQTRSKIHIQGRPCTSMSQTSEPSRLKSGSSGQRPKTTGRLKNVKSATDSFMVLNVDEDMLETRRSHNELTNQIHAHWRPENSNLNQGHFMRGQKRPDDVPPTLDAWLTFGGVAGEESGGVVDAFANFQSPDDYYNIEGSVGSRVAQQLQKGDRIRIGINGEVLSHDLKVKKWVKGDQSPRENGHRETPRMAEEEEEEGGRRAEAREEQAPESAREKPSPAAAQNEEEDPFGDMIFQNLEDLVLNTEADAEGKENSDTNRRTKILIDFPLSWEDQVSRPEVKVISARPTPRDGNRENLCETHPVLYNRVVRHSQPRPKLASTAQAANGYRVKQRPLGNGGSGNSRADSSNRLADGSGSKVRAISFDHNSPEEEQRLSNMSVDDVIQMRLERSATSPLLGMPSSTRARAKNGQAGGGGGEEEECNASARRARKAADQRLKDKTRQRSYSAVSKSSGRSLERAGKGQQSLSSSSSAASGRPLTLVPRPSSSVPLRGSRDMDLSIVTPVASRSRLSERVSSGKGGRSQTTSKSVHYPRGLGGGVNSINAGPIPGDTEFIQISQPIRNPNSSLASMSSAGAGRSLHSPYPINISNINNNNNNSAASTPLPRNSPLRSNTPEDGLANSEISPRTITPTTAEGRVDPNKPGISLNQNGNGNEGQSHLNGRQNGPEPGPTPEPSLLNQGGGGGGGGGGGSGGGSESAEDDGARSAPASESAASLQSAPGAKAISIPTGGHLQDDEDEEELTVAQRRERTLRDQQIDQITDLLVGAIVGGEQK